MPSDRALLSMQPGRKASIEALIRDVWVKYAIGSSVSVVGSLA